MVILSPEHYQLATKKFTTRKSFQAALRRASNLKSSFHIAFAVVDKHQKYVFIFQWLIRLVLGTILGSLCWFLTFFFGLTLLPKFETDDVINVVVAGGPAGKFTLCVAGFGAGFQGFSTRGLSLPTTESVVDSLGDLLPESSSSLTTTKKHRDKKIVDPRVDEDMPSSVVNKEPPRPSLTKIGLLDISKGGSKEFLDGLTPLLKTKAPVIRFRKPTFARRAPTKLLDDIVSSGVSHVVLGLAD